MQREEWLAYVQRQTETSEHRPTERLREPREHHKIGVKRDPEHWGGGRSSVLRSLGSGRKKRPTQITIEPVLANALSVVAVEFDSLAN